MPEHDEHLVTMSLAEAAVALGLSTDAVRARIRRGHLEGRTGNDGRKLVLVPRSQLEGDKTEHRSGSDQAATELAAVMRSELDRLVAELDRTRADSDRLRSVAEEARLAAARAETERDGLRIALAIAETEITRLRLPFWRRWLG